MTQRQRVDQDAAKTPTARTGRSPCALLKGGGCAPGMQTPQRSETADPATWEKIKDHPCYSAEAHHYFARMHVPVAPACNIQCNYCNRKFDCVNESRPGVVSKRWTPEEAADKVAAVAAQVPQLSVVGAAGPGDAVFDARKTLRTFELVRRKLPDLRLCVSTNGLALPEQVDALKALDVDHITVTINYTDPAVGAQIHPWIVYDRRQWGGEEAARILHERQMEGLERAVEAGMLVKVNSVMIPGINDGAELSEVNRRVRERGVFLHNVMPLISDPSHGTHFGLEGRRGPTQAELHAKREELGGDAARMMRHCRQCRADAIGMLGDDIRAQLDLDAPGGADAGDAGEQARIAHRARVEGARSARAGAAVLADAAIARAAPAGEERLVAVCSAGEGRINLHFGKATEFHVYKVGAGGIRFAGVRRADTHYCLGGYGDPDALTGILKALPDIDAVLCVKIGDGPRERLARNGIGAQEVRHDTFIETALAHWYGVSVPSGPDAVEAAPAETNPTETTAGAEKGGV